MTTHEPGGRPYWSVFRVDPGRAARLARLLWIVFALVVWNVVFDRVLVLAGRRYVYEASVAAASGRYLRAADWMGPAVTRGLWLATASAGAILAIGLASIRLAIGRRRPGDSR